MKTSESDTETKAEVPTVPERPEKNLNQRIEDLVLTMERSFSWRASFMRGTMQGLGFIIGSTIIAGIGYTVLTQFISPEVLHEVTFQSALERGTK